MKNKEQSNIDTRTLFLCGTIIVLLLTIMYLLQTNKIMEEEKLQTSYLISTNTVSLQINTLEELESLLSETPTGYFIFTGYKHDSDEYKLEKDLKPIIDDYNLHEIFYYLDITDFIEDEDEEFLADLSRTLNTQITTVPTIIYYSNDLVANKVEQSSNEYLKASDFEKLLEMYEFEKSK